MAANPPLLAFADWVKPILYQIVAGKAVILKDEGEGIEDVQPTSMPTLWVFSQLTCIEVRSYTIADCTGII